ncbi:Iron dependent repressor, DtxR family [Desulfonema limicola]|uniref:Transcriptional regulator MntR n=1 Tax=Desulfonema limicola TaxID=45656 RepID=A0A975BAY6_9BACT|nr:metal-dependent transcriptional regulator [Desulfonema limicola]QTA82186.1 Iron dependent repressor, DtxR family [Desulfonema limicola]
MTNDVLSASMEDYLEAIFLIIKEKQTARAKDIVNLLNVNNSSVTGALRSLSDKGLINYAPYDLITLTDKGEQHALGVVLRHKALKDFFIKILGADESEAETTACKMEHVISPNILEKLIKFVEFAEYCPVISKGWIKSDCCKCERLKE